MQSIPLQKIDGAPASLADYRGQVLLVVNVASKCGLTPQYEGLERIYERYRPQGFAVLGFPANDFAGQEPGTNEEIQAFCRTNYSVDFPMFAKIAVTGPEQHPLYQALTSAQPDAMAKPGTDFRQALVSYGIRPNPAPGVLWNFEKFLIGRDGDVMARFAPDVPPDDPLVTDAIESALAAR
ncbi:MAG TPA: glutathione peroxidase [Steroidobacteraceae bacterium]|nr:glutathione peroxidase [Steroidobacteraceae bacterium]